MVFIVGNLRVTGRCWAKTSRRHRAAAGCNPPLGRCLRACERVVAVCLRGGYQEPEAPPPPKLLPPKPPKPLLRAT